jgi:hypothetical protein
MRKNPADKAMDFVMPVFALVALGLLIRFVVIVITEVPW